MTEEKKEEVVEEVSATEEKQEETQASPEPKEEKKRDNWEEARAVMAAQKAEIEAMKKYMAMLEQQKVPVQQEEPEDELDKLDPKELLTVEQAKKLASKQAKQAAQEIVKEYAANNRLTIDEQRMRQEEQDYDYVLENFAIPLIKKDPALAYRIQSSPNPAETAYMIGKMTKEYKAHAKVQETSPAAAKILKNSQRPTAASAVQPSLKKQVDDASKMSKQDIWALSEKYSRGGGQ